MGQREWKETARWIKYEEDLEEGADRWGRPHIASLSFHSLIKLRKLIERDGKSIIHCSSLYLSKKNTLGFI
jgi:hypothetical protein